MGVWWAFRLVQFYGNEHIQIAFILDILLYPFFVYGRILVLIRINVYDFS